MEQDNENVHDIFKLDHMHNGDSGLNLHAAISKEAERLQERATSESTWRDDLERERQDFKLRIDVIIKNHNVSMLREGAHIAAFQVQADLTESKHKYIRQVNDSLKAMWAKRKPLLEKYTNSSKRYTGKQIDEMIEGDLCDLLFIIKTLNDHIEALDKFASMMTNITFSMKYFNHLDDFTKK